MSGLALNPHNPVTDYCRFQPQFRDSNQRLEFETGTDVRLKETPKCPGSPQSSHEGLPSFCSHFKYPTFELIIVPCYSCLALCRSHTEDKHDGLSQFLGIRMQSNCCTCNSLLKNVTSLCDISGSFGLPFTPSISGILIH